MALQQLKLYEYTDYRQYLKDFYELQKKSTKKFSFRAFAKRAGFSSPNFLKLVIDHKRNLTPDSISMVCNAMQLSDNQREYFRELVLMNQAKSDADKELHFKKMTQLVPSVSKRILGEYAHKYLSHWLYPVLRELVCLEDFKEDPYWIARKLNFKVTVSQINSALEFLKSEGYLKYNAAKKLELVDKIIQSPDEVASFSYRNYHREMIKQAIESLEVIALNEREFGSLTFVLPKNSVAELKHKIKDFRKNLHLWAVEQIQDHHADVVYQINIQAYPHTKGRLSSIEDK